MLKYLLSALISVFLVLVSGCQTHTTAGSGLFSPTYPSGMTLAQSVQEALIQSNDPVIAQVRVETNQNTVILSGYVKKIRQSDIAEQIARNVQGVQMVQNNIIVRP
ncbi:hypothetical protein EP47_11095 [Legionella norrlandica]|uniref:BON domain-containing protein n=1 Tax=Legionella norrlandica TaxID=1498499 RepID=A0A0A2SSX2_9GAMM|nr:BON domain-containing protein [Legionella norrlandica]KGP62539.1 hypothetical protein EP47_11095 [Legionella norrlandica]